MIDKAGNASFSRAAVITAGAAERFSVYPNLVSSQLTLTYSPANQQRILQVLSADGRGVKLVVLPAGSTQGLTSEIYRMVLTF